MIDRSNPKNRVKFSRNMMKGIRMKKFNELRIRLKDRKSMGFSRGRNEPSSDVVARKEREAKVRRIVMVEE